MARQRLLNRNKKKRQKDKERELASPAGITKKSKKKRRHQEEAGEVNEAPEEAETTAQRVLAIDSYMERRQNGGEF